MRNPRLVTFALAAALAARPCAANVVIRPHFGHPLIFPERVVFSSVNGKSLIAIDKQGRLQWELSFSERIQPQRLDAASVVIQEGRSVFQIDVVSGKKSLYRRVPKNARFEVDSDLGITYLWDSRPNHRETLVLAGDGRTPRWTTRNVEAIEHVTSTTIVALKTVRQERADSSFTITGATLVGLDRDSGEVRWSLSPPGSPPEFLRSVAVGGNLAVLSGLFAATLLVLNPDTGQVLSSRTGRFTDLAEAGSRLAVLEEGEGPGDAGLSFCELPECAPGKAVALKAKEILQFRLHGDYVITAGIYDMACFSRSTAKRLWQKGQMEWSIPFEDSMIVTDFEAQSHTSRIVSIRLSDGTETVLFARPVTKRDENEFLPW